MVTVTPKAISVSELTRYLKTVLDGDYHLQNILVTGEISNFTAARSGHLYLTLKDRDAALRVVMFRSHASRLRFRPEDGMNVVVFGSISLYEASGQYQLYAESMMPDGVGERNLALEQLKEKLSNEGLFDSAHKKPIPRFPQRIGVVTSPTGAAFQDIQNVLARRWPVAELVLAPAMVQGEPAPAQIVAGIELLDRSSVDVILVCRGGGSIEDLWCFNDESIARAVYACETPVISGVGHETDVTLIDFVADDRAPTPSAAVEHATPDRVDEEDRILRLRNRMRVRIRQELNEQRARVQYLKTSNVLRSFPSLLGEQRLRIDQLEEHLHGSLTRSLQDERSRLSVAAGKLVAYNPLQVLARGYSIARAPDGTVIRSTGQVVPGDPVTLRVEDGTLDLRTEAVHPMTSQEEEA